MTSEGLAGTRALLVGDGELKLTPEATKSPNDPLNWSKPRKYWHAALVLYIVGLTAANPPMMSRLPSTACTVNWAFRGPL